MTIMVVARGDMDDVLGGEGLVGGQPGKGHEQSRIGVIRGGNED